MTGYGENLLVNSDCLDGIPALDWQHKELARLGRPLDGAASWREAFDALAQARNEVRPRTVSH